jgi:hypothetical protein
LGFLILWGFPLVVSLGPIVVGKAIKGKGLRAQLLVMLAFALLALGFGAWCLCGRASGVPVAQALEGAALAAGFLVLLPAALYLQLGARVRPLLAGVIWLVSLIPLAAYMLIVALGVWQRLECPPAETCSLLG